MKSQAGNEKIRIMRIIARLNIGGPAIHTILLSSDMQTFGYETLLVAGRVGSGEGDMAYLAEAHGVKPIIVPQLGQRLHPGDNLHPEWCRMPSLKAMVPC